MESLDSLQREAIKSYHNANYSESIKIINKILQIDSNDLIALSNRATCHYKLELYQHCLKDCDMVLKIDPENRLMMLRKSMAMSNIKSMATKSGDLLQSALDSWGEFEITDFLMMNINNNNHNTTTSNKQLEDSIQFFSNSSPSSSLSPNSGKNIQDSSVSTSDIIISSLSGSAGLGSELKKSTSLDELNQLLEQLSTENIATEVSKGNYLVNSGHYEEAIQLFTLIINSNPLIPSAFLGRGTSNAIVGNLDEAIYDFSKVIDLDNTMADAYKRRGQSRVAKGMDFEALEDFNQAAIFDKDCDSDIYYQRGLLHYQMRNYERSLRDFRKVVEYDPKNKLAWNRIGLCLNIRGYPREAFDAFDRAIELDSEFEAAFTNVGQCWKELGNFNRSYDAFTEALTISPRYSNALHLRGILFFNSGKHLQAIQDWNDFLDQDSTVADLRQLRGISYYTIGNYKESIKDFNYIVENYPLHFSYYQREIALFTHQRLDIPLSSFNIDRLMNVYIKTFLCQRVSPSSLIGYIGQPQLSSSIEDINLSYRANENERILIDEALKIGSKLQYDAEGFLPNKRQHLQCGMAVLEIAQTLKKIWNTTVDENGSQFKLNGQSSSSDNDEHMFGWRDLYDIAVRWRQYSEPNDPVWWVDLLSAEQFREGFGSHTPLITGQTNVVRYYPMFGRAFEIVKQLLPIQFKDVVQKNPGHLNEIASATNCKDLYKLMKKDFFVITPCYSSYRPETIMEGTRLTLQFVYPEGYEFAIRTPCTPERWQLYDQEMQHVWSELCKSVHQLKTKSRDPGLTDDQKDMLLDAVSDNILKLTFYWYNFMPLTRGSAAVGYTVLLGIFLSLDIDISTKIIKNQQPDWEGILRPTVDSFIKVIKPWMYPARQPTSTLDQLPNVSETITTLRQLIQLLNQSL